MQFGFNPNNAIEIYKIATETQRITKKKQYLFFKDDRTKK